MATKQVFHEHIRYGADTFDRVEADKLIPSGESRESARRRANGPPVAASDLKEPRFRPLGNQLLVRVTQPEIKTPSGIILPDQPDPTEGVVVHVGPGLYEHGVLRPVDLRVGERVRLGPWNDKRTIKANTITLEGEELFFCREPDIIGVWR